jgi:hypothetical protein
VKPPVLRVKRGADFYDDSRGEELTAASAVQDAIPAPRRRGRRRGITFLPLLVVVIGMAVAFQLAARRDTTSFAGWLARLAASPSGDALDVSVMFTRRAGVPASTARGEASVHILLPDSGATLDLVGALGAPTITLRGRLPLVPAVRVVKADVTIGTERRSLAAGIRRP